MALINVIEENMKHVLAACALMLLASGTAAAADHRVQRSASAGCVADVHDELRIAV